MAKAPAWKRPGSPIGKKGPRKANPKYKRNMRKPWTRDDTKTLKQLAKENTPTRIIGLKMGRTVPVVRYRARTEGVSLKPVNQSPNKPRKRGAKRK